MPSTSLLFAPTVSTNPWCTHELLDNGIHQITVNKISPEAVDAYFQILDDIYSNSSKEETVRILNHSSFGALAISTLLGQVRSMLNRHSRPPRTRQALVVVPFQPQIVEVLMRTQPVSRHKMRYFSADEETQAVEWLLRDN